MSVVMRQFRLLNHTGDLAMEIQGVSLKDLYENAGMALFSVVTDRSKIRKRVERSVALRYADRETLLVDWLGELLYLHDVERLLFRRFHVVTIEKGFFEALAWGEPFESERHAIRTAIKAVTFHQLEVCEHGGRWRARVVLDL
jgi:SHS2 domain-containing protein